MNEPDTVTFTQVVKIADADGRPIRVGSVLREITDGDQGVVVQIVRAGMICSTPLACVGDIHIEISRGSTRCTNRYNQWRHVPRIEQTYAQRLRAWQLVPYDHDEDREASKDEGLAIDGIMALLPEDVDWENGPWPDRIDDALQFLVEHLEQLARQPHTN